MNLQNERQLANTQHKLAMLEEQITRAKERIASPENDESVQSLTRMANQLREEIVRYQSARQRRASDALLKGNRIEVVSFRAR